MFLSLLSRVLIFSVSVASASDHKSEHKTEPTKVASGDEAKVVLLKEIDEKYQKAKSIVMDVKKIDKISALDQTKEGIGTLKLKKGRFRLEIQAQDKGKETSTIVADGKILWFVTPPAKEFKNSKTLVVKASLTDKRAKTQGLLQILTGGGVLKYFKTSGVTEDGDRVTYFLQPNKKSVELQRAQVVASKKDKTITQLKYWDTVDNETDYQFSKIELDTTLKDELFEYTPPKDADVTSY